MIVKLVVLFMFLFCFYLLQRPQDWGQHVHCLRYLSQNETSFPFFRHETETINVLIRPTFSILY